MIPRLSSWARACFRRSRMEREMDSELHLHIEEYASDLIRSGVPSDEAHRRAHVEFGSIEARKDDCREARGLRVWDELQADLRYAFRLLKQSPAFTSVAILSLALGIGANSALFSLMETVLWKTIPVKDPQQLRLFYWVSGKNHVMNSTWGNFDEGRGSTSFSYPVYEQLHREKDTFQTVFAFKPLDRITAVINGNAELLTAQLLSGNFYEGAGVSTMLGRPIGPEDDNRSGAVTVISDAFWARRFGRDSSVIGKTIELNQIPMTIIGVNAPSFTGLQPGQNPDVFVPMKMQPVFYPWTYTKNGDLLINPDYWWVIVMGRLRPGVSELQAQAATDVILQQAVKGTLPDRGNRDMPRMKLVPGGRGLDDLGSEFGKRLLVLVPVVGVVLLIACVNLANLLLSRAAARQRELSVRVALGASRGRIVRQMLTEGLLLASLGGSTGVSLGYWMRDAIPSLLTKPWGVSPFRADFDMRVLLISVAVTVLTGLVFSLVPTWQSTRVELNSVLKDGGRNTLGRSRLLVGKALVVFQVCLSVLLLVGAGLFLRTLSNVRSASLGFQPDSILLFTVDPPRTRYPNESRGAVFEKLAEQVAAIPGVQVSSLSSEALVSQSSSTTRAVPTGRAPRPDNADQAWVNDVGPRFFETMGIPMLSGRPIEFRDKSNSQWVAVVNQQFGRKFFPNENPLGKTFVNNEKTIQIIGICGDARYNRVDRPVPPTFYRPFLQHNRLGRMNFEIKTAMPEAAMVHAIREAVRSVDKDLPVFDIRTQRSQIDATHMAERMFAVLTSAFGLLALILACVGIYGVMANAVARRTNEIGVRMALGAQNGQVLGMILREATLLTVIGIITGLGAALWLMRFIRTMLYGIEPFDPLTLVIAVLFMLTVALGASWWPARRASRVDPMVALRHE